MQTREGDANVAVLKKGDRISASTVVSASPDEVYAIVSDITRIPEWSPECIDCTWLDDKHFRGRNRRRFGRWQTVARVDANTPGSEFSFTVQFRKADFTRWSYRMQSHPDGCLLTEEFTMCAELPFAVVAYERLALGVKDRATDLQGNLDQCVRTIKAIVEADGVTVR